MNDQKFANVLLTLIQGAEHLCLTPDEVRALKRAIFLLEREHGSGKQG